MIDLSALERLIAQDHGLAVVSVTRSDGTVSSTVVNAGLLPHPADGETVLGFVIRGNAFKRKRLLADGRVTVAIRAGWSWQAVEGHAELIGPLDPPASADIDTAALLRAIFVAAGGTHDDWPTYDKVMADEQRTAVLVRVARVYGNADV